MFLKIWKLLSRFAPPLLWAGMIFYLSSQKAVPGFPNLKMVDFIARKIFHIFLYAVLYFFTYRAWNFDKPEAKRNWILPLLLCLLYAISDETHQLFTPTRTSSLRDVGYDFLGIVIVFLRIYQYI